MDLLEFEGMLEDGVRGSLSCELWRVKVKVKMFQ